MSHHAEDSREDSGQIPTCSQTPWAEKNLVCGEEQRSVCLKAVE